MIETFEKFAEINERKYKQQIKRVTFSDRIPYSNNLIYNDDELDELLDSDKISSAEEGFMRGYMRS